MAGKLTPVRVIVVLLVWFLPVLAQRPAMVAAARRGDLAALRSLLADKSDINNARSRPPGLSGRTERIRTAGTPGASLLCKPPPTMDTPILLSF